MINAAPMVIDLGTEDLSTRTLPRAPEEIPQHLPKIFLWAQRGNTLPHLVVGNERQRMYGDATFDYLDKYSNHATPFANYMNTEGNSQMLQRVIPEDAGPKANMTFWLDVLATKVPKYKRHIDGAIQLDELGEPIVDSIIDGYKVKWVITRASTHEEARKIGSQDIEFGDQVDPDTGERSTRYPMHEWEVLSQGSYGNDCGINLFAPTQDDTVMPTTMMSEKRAYPYKFRMIERQDGLTTPKIMPTIFGEYDIQMVFKPETIDPTTTQELSADKIVFKSYHNDDSRYPTQYSNFPRYVQYVDNMEHVLKLFHQAEIPHIDEFSDFNEDENDFYLFNFISGVSSANVPYHSFHFVDDSDSVRLTKHTNIYAGGGSDGTMNDETYAALVSAQMNRYADPIDEIQDIAVNVESIYYDSGLPLKSKYDAIKFISERKDTFVVLSTFTHGEPTFTPSQEHAMAIALRTRLQMYPESSYFGTHVMRGMIMGRDARIRNSLYRERVPSSLEVAIKSARYMGAGHGRWKAGKNFDNAPLSVIDYLYDFNETWVPRSVRNRNWDVGLNFVLNFNRREQFFPALKTCYDDDTSVLNSYFTAMAICYLNKVAHATWRDFSGSAGLTNEQLEERMNAKVIELTTGRFDGRYIIQPRAFHTYMDKLRGYSVSLPIEIYSPNMKTVMTTYVQALRIDDFGKPVVGRTGI